MSGFVFCLIRITARLCALRVWGAEERTAARHSKINKVSLDEGRLWPFLYGPTNWASDLRPLVPAAMSALCGSALNLRGSEFPVFCSALWTVFPDCGILPPHSPQNMVACVGWEVVSVRDNCQTKSIVSKQTPTLTA